MNWSRNTLTIRELYNKYSNYDLILQPFFQRNLVWTDKAKSHFIESVLLEMPISEIYLNDEDGKFSIIDGQQRLSTIFHFFENRIKLSGLENLETFNGYHFTDLPEEKQQQFLEYRISYVAIERAVKEEVIDMYSRINKYTVNLNDQELRKAAFNDSDFLKLAEELSQDDFFERSRFFTPRKRQRMNDIEFISELLCILFDGIQDKKNTLDSFYDRYSQIENFQQAKESWEKILQHIQGIFSTEYMRTYMSDERYDGDDSAVNLGKTRYRQQADFYTLFAVVKDALLVAETSLNESQQEQLAKLLLFFDEMIEPESDISIFREYAIKCSTQGNTYQSRLYRYRVLLAIFEFVLTQEENQFINTLQQEMKDIFDLELNPHDVNVKATITHVDTYYEKLFAEDE